MRIIFFMESLRIGGAERMAVRLANAFVSDYEWDVSFILLSNDLAYTLDPRIKISVISGYAGRNKLFKYFYTRSAFCRITKIENPDIVFGLLFWPLTYTLLLKKRYLLVCSERGNPAYKGSLKTRISEKLVVWYSDCIIFQTEAAASMYSSRAQKKGVVIPNYVSADITSIDYDIKHREKLICAVGSLSAIKDYPTLFEAFRIVREKHPDYQLEVYGKDTMHSQLHEYLVREGIQNVILHLPVEDVWKHLVNPTCYVLCSLSEGLPNSLMEAMAIGIPSISTDCDVGPRTLITHLQNGQLIPVGDVIALAAAICRYIEDEPFAERVSKNARLGMQRYSKEHVINEFVDYFENSWKAKGKGRLKST